MALPIGLIVFLVLAGIVFLALLWLVGRGVVEGDSEVQANYYNYDDGDDF